MDLKYHGPSRNPDMIVSFLKDYVGPPVRIPITRGVTIFLYVLCAIGVILALTYSLLIIVKPEFFKYQTWEFCILINLGAIMGYVSVLLLLPDNQNDKTCWSHIWLFGMSFWFVFLGFFVKVARIYYIVWKSSKTMTVAVLSIWQIMPFMVLACLCEAGFNIAWDKCLPPNLEREDFFSTNEYVLYCAGNRYMWLGSVATRAAFLGLGVLLAVKTRHMPQELNWSKEVSMAIYTMAVILIIGIPLGFALNGSSQMVVLLKGVTTCVAYITVTTIVHYDSLKRLLLGQDARDFTTESLSRQSTGSKAGTTT